MKTTFLVYAWVAAGLLLFQGRPLSAQTSTVIQLPPHNAVATRRFTRVTSSRELTDGTLLVGDQAENVLVAIRFESEETVEIGREGEGPGEHRGVGWLYDLGSDSTLFTDAFHSRWNIYYRTQFVTSYSESRPINRTLSAQLAGATPGGLVVGTFPENGGPRLSADSLLVVMVDRATGSMDTVARIRARGGSGPAFLPATRGRPFRSLVAHNPLASEDQVLFFPDGWLAVAHVDPYRVDWRSPEGVWRLGANLSVARLDANVQERCFALIRMLGEMDHCEPSALPDWPTFVPAFLPPTNPDWNATLLGTSAGHLVVRRTPVSSDSVHRYDVVDRRGLVVQQIGIPREQFILGFGAQSVYVVGRNEMGLQTIRRHDWPSTYNR